jgi:hypothetical protein
MPLEKTEDYALGNTSSAYCRYCTDEQGSLLPYEQILKANAGYFQETQGIEAEAARKMAADVLREQPAWKNRGAR